MGEAKRRGGFEQRKAMAIERHRIELSERNKRKAEIERKKTPEQRRKEFLTLQALAMFSGLVSKDTTRINI